MRRAVAVLTLVAGLLVSCSNHQIRLDTTAPATFSEEPGGYEEATVTRVVDGDTIEVSVTGVVEGPGAGSARPGGTYDVRLIGIDTPESVHPQQPVECFGREASAAAKALLEGESVKMVTDISDTDRYDRLLRYVYLGAEMANARLVANGYAYAYTYPPDIRWSELFVQLQREARANGRGLWSPDTCSGGS